MQVSGTMYRLYGPLYHTVTMAPLHVAIRTVQGELPKYEHLAIGSLPYLCTKNETMAPLHVATLTVQRLPFSHIIIVVNWY